MTTPNFSVETDSLSQYYTRLWDIHDRLDVSAKQGGELRRHAEAPDSYGGHRITGVEHALHAARISAHGAAGHTGQHHTLLTLRRIVTGHLGAVYASYNGYLGTDADQSQGLGTAGAGGAGLPATL